MINEKVWCERHLKNPITHVCISEGCFLPLCGKCIKEHNSSHKLKNSFPEFETIEDLREICLQKISNHLEKYKSTLENCKYSLNSNVLDRFVDLINKIQSSLNNIIDLFFVEVKEGLRSVLKEESLGKQFKNEMTSVLQDLKQREIEMENSPSIPLMKQILTLNYDKTYNEYQSFSKNCQLSTKNNFLPEENEVNQFIENFKDSLDQLFICKSLKYQQTSQINQINTNSKNQDYYYSSSKPYLPAYSKNPEPLYKFEKYESPNKKVSFAEHPVYDITKAFYPAKSTKIATPDSEYEKKYDNLIKSSQNLEATRLFTPQKTNFLGTPSYYYNKESKSLTTHEKTTKIKKEALNDSCISFSPVKSFRHPPLRQDFCIESPDYFKSCSGNKKYLHFFQPKSKFLHLFELNDENPNEVSHFKRDLSIDFLLPRWHKSISAPNGQLFLVGGASLDKKASKLNSFFLYSFEYNTLILKPSMKVSRSSFGLVYFHDCLYVVGGNIEDSQTTSRCEKFLMNEEKWEDVASLNLPSSNHCVCCFNNCYLYKFGGKLDDNFLNRTIEKYNPNINKWVIVSFRFEDLSQERKFRLLAFSGCCQLNNSQIFVFGGCEEEFSKKSDQSFIFQVNEKQERFDHVIRKLNEKRICFSEGFWESCPLIHKQKLYALQNFSDENEKNVTFLDRRSLLCFDGLGWSCLDV